MQCDCNFAKRKQLAVKYLAIIITVAQLGAILSAATTWQFAEKQAKTHSSSRYANS